jgi:preprotein translocase subunit SecB
MILAPLQLSDYWLESVHIRTNPDFDPNREADLEVDSMEVKSDVQMLKSDNPGEVGTVWMVLLEIRQNIPQGKNIPYEFSVDMRAIVAAHPSLTDEKLERAVQVNGPSMLFGAAREIVRAATGRGPYAPVIIPSTNFFHRIPRPQALPAPEPTKSVKKAAKKSTRKGS